MPKWLTAVIGAAEIAAGAVLTATGVGAPFGAMLISAGIGTTISGIGTLMSKGPLTGTSTATKNPIKAWDIIYGRAAVGGTPIYIGSFGDSDKYLDLVFAIAGHPCQDVYGLMFDRQRIQMDTTAVPPGVPASSFPAINGGTSFTPVQQTVSMGTISRVNNVVTVSLGADIPLLMAGDYVIIQNVTGDKTLNGKFQVAQILSQTYVPGSPGSISFTYLCGGPEVTYTGQGQVKTTWADYGRKVYMETLLGTQTLGQTFVGMTAGTPNDGDTGDLITNGPGNNANPWTRYCSGVGKTLVFLRLHYNDTYFANGLPQISFLVHGKNNIVDPRTSPPAVGYSENAALCIADMLCDQTWGYKCALGTDIPIGTLITAANVCDQAVALAATSATEPRYTVNGKFDLTMKRGEILQNMLTACGGRITYQDGQFTIWPATFNGSASAGSGWRLGARLIVPSYAGTFQLNWEDQWGGGDQSFGNGTVQIIFDGAGGATMQFMGNASFTAYSDDFGVGGVRLVGKAMGVNGPVAIPVVPAPGTELLVEIFSPAGQFFSGPPSNNPDDVAHAYLARSPSGYGPNLDVAPWGPFKWRSTGQIRDLYNGVKGTYISPGNNWQSSDFPPYCQDTLHGYVGPSAFEGDINLAYDGGDRRWFDIQLPFTISAATAQRLAKIELLRRRNSGGNSVGSGTFALSMAGYQLTALDIITMTVPFLSWNDKLLEVEAHRFKFDKTSAGNGEGVICLGTEIDVQETSESNYAWSATEELTPQGYRQSIVPSTGSPAAPTGVTAISGIPATITGADGINRSSILVSWTAPVDGFVTNGGHIEAQYQLATTPPGPWIALPSVPASVTQISIANVRDGSLYNVQIRSVNAAGVPSAWVSAGPVLVTALPTVLVEVNGGSGYELLTVNLGDVFDAYEVNGL